ncbi:MAG: hypothetical protein Q8P27_02960, partial [Candidatus Peregrinibacteria bacterium]|nr:hypothetical protein [Candidatus Peregrinibacteria bacterium]
SKLFPATAKEILPFFEKMKNFTFTKESMLWLKHAYVWALLLTGNYEKAGEMLRPFEKDAIKNYNSPFFSLYGCYLNLTEGQEISTIHYHGVFESKYPPTSALLAHYLLGHIEYLKINDEWMTGAFLWEKLELYRYHIIHYSCLRKKRKVQSILKIFESIRENTQIPLDFL